MYWSTKEKLPHESKNSEMKFDKINWFMKQIDLNFFQYLV